MTSAIAAVLVHADRSPASARRAGLAADLAARLGAGLTGASAGMPYIPAYAPFGETFISLQTEVITAAQRDVTAALSAAEAAFRKMAGKDAAWRQSLTTSSAALLSTLSRSADLVIAGPSAPGEDDPLLGVEVSDLVMSAGRPILVTPHSMERLSAKSAVVAWKDTRESRRAVFDALPLLLKSEEVVVATAGSGDDIRGASDVATWLKSHGVNATALSENSSDAGAAEALANIAARQGADLIVAGAFGHSRTREWVFGGVTRSLLSRSKTAVLFSH